MTRVMAVIVAVIGVNFIMTCIQERIAGIGRMGVPILSGRALAAAPEPGQYEKQAPHASLIGRNRI